MAATRRLTVTKAPQCRHSENQGFVSYTQETIAGIVFYTAVCSNCSSESRTGHITQDGARLDLMGVEAPPLVNP